MKSTPTFTPSAIPVTILTGFLGAGKTTLLQRMLADPQGRRLGVLVNDFGAINIDAALIVESSADQIALSNGCICCTLRDDLVAALGQMLSVTPCPEHILIEASGVSRPVAIVDALDHPTVKDQVALDAVLCVVDSAAFRSLDFASTELAIDQASGSDLVLLNKADLATREDMAAIEKTLRGAFPQVRLLRTRYASVPNQVLFAPRLDAVPAAESGHDPEGSCRNGHLSDSAAFGHEHTPAAETSDHPVHPHDREFESWSWTSNDPL